jgi:hypothetical protein
MTRFLGLDGNLAVGYDINWTDGWNQMLNDFVNAETEIYDPRHCTFLLG